MTVFDQQLDALPQKAIPEAVSCSVRIFAYPWQKPRTEISQFITTITWEEDAKAVAIEATISLSDPSGATRDLLAPGTWLLIQVKDFSTLDPHTMFLYVWSRTLFDRAQPVSVQITAIDTMSFLQRQGTQNYIFKTDKQHPKGWTATEITTRVLDDLEIKHNLYPTQYRIPYLELQGATPFEVMANAYGRDNVKSGTLYTFRSVSQVILVDRFYIQDRIWDLSEGYNIQTASWSETMDNMATEVVARSTGKLNGQVSRAIRVVSPNVRRYGTLTQAIYYNYSYGADVLSRLATRKLKHINHLTTDVQIDADGIADLRATDAVTIHDSGTGLKGRFFATNVSHTITGGNHTMTVGLSKTYHLPTINPSKDELHPQPVISRATVTGPGALGAQIIGPAGKLFGGFFMSPLANVEYVIISNEADHKSRCFGNWQSDCAVDMHPKSGAVGTPVVAAFSGTFARVNLDNESKHGGKIFGAQIGITSNDGQLSAFYTHIENVPPAVKEGAKIQIGQQIGTITRWDDSPDASHLHFALHQGAYGDALPCTKKCDTDPEQVLKGIQNDPDLPASSAPTDVTPGSGVPQPVAGGAAPVGGGGLADVAAMTRAKKITWVHSNDQAAALGNGVVTRQLGSGQVTIDPNVWNGMASIVNAGFTINIESMVGTHPQFVAGSNNTRESRHWTGHAFDISDINGTNILDHSCEANAIAVMDVAAQTRGIDQIIHTGDGTATFIPAIEAHEVNGGVLDPGWYRGTDHANHIHVGY